MASDPTPTCPRCGSTNVSSHGHAPALGQPNPYDAIYEEGYRCRDCTFLESHWNNDDGYEEFKKRWNDWREVPWEEIKASVEDTNRILEQQEREWTWPAEDSVTDQQTRARKLADEIATKNLSVVGERPLPKNPRLLEAWFEDRIAWPPPQHPELFKQIIQHPDETVARFEFARWMRTKIDPFAEHEYNKTPRTAQVADFIEAQLRLAELANTEARAAFLEQLGRPTDQEFRWLAFTSKDRANWWRYPSHDLTSWLGGNSLSILQDEGLIDDLRWHRGFVEHVAIKAHRFLEIADELYSLAPIRYLTITYAKGLDHRDTGLWKALLESPYLDRIRSLRFPAAVLRNEYTELNRLTDDDIEQLAAAAHMRGLRHLDLEDQRQLTIRAFDALAASKNLGELSHVQHDIYRYEHAGAFTFGNFGPRTKTLVRRPLMQYANELEQRNGHIAWLHPADYYGTEEPDPEAVVEHPAALLRSKHAHTS